MVDIDQNSDTQALLQVMQLAGSDPASALEVARQIRDQILLGTALSVVMEHTDEYQIIRDAWEARPSCLRQADLGKDLYPATDNPWLKLSAYGVIDTMTSKLRQATESMRRLRGRDWEPAATAEIAGDPATRDRILQQALDEASSLPAPYLIALESAAALSVIAKAGQHDRLRREVARVLAVVATEPHPTRRSDALMILVRYLHDAPQDCFRAVLDAFEESCRSGHGWKRDRNLRDAAVILRKTDPEMALKFVDLIEKPRARRQALKMINEAGGQRTSGQTEYGRS